MSIAMKNNLSPLNALNTLNKNSTTLANSLQNLSSGLKIVNAGDGASEYAISERMRTQIRSLEQDVVNVQNGASLLKIAAGGIENIVEELRNLKELALNSANDHNNLTNAWPTLTILLPQLTITANSCFAAITIVNLSPI